MIQLRVYTDDTDTAEQQYIDLYETEPIKLNLSIEDITNAEAASVFSRTFRVPATGNNNQFFKHAYLIDGIDYDVTIKKPAEILVNGAEFRQGHIRLQKIYTDKYRDRIDYEIIFLGETRDFSSQIGDAPMCQLEIPGLIHDVNRENIIDSWDAYDGFNGTTTSGLKNGDILYPLIDHGAIYPSDWNDPNTVRLSFEPVDPVESPPGSGQFIYNNFHHEPLQLNRMKPMIRAKALWDQIFEDSGYTYTSDFIEPASGDANIFTQLYVSAFGNEASIFNDLGTTNNTFEANTTATLAADDWFYLPNVVVASPGFDVGVPVDPQTGVGGSEYTVQAQGNHIHNITVDLFYGEDDNEGDPIDGCIALYKWTTQNPQWTRVAKGAAAYGYGLTLTTTQNANPTDKFRVKVIADDPQFEFDSSDVDTPSWAITSAPGQSNPVYNMDCEYKQIDFIKDILTTFRLVMAPDPKDAKNFIVEPWVDYVNNGDLYDWSDKLVEDKDQVIEPLFFTQSDEIKFTHAKDSDWLNTYHTAAYNNNYGYLEFDSGNELLTGTREVKTNWAPTPMTQIEGVDNTSQFVIPQLHVHESADGETQHLPIKPKTRFLFYTGLHSVGDTAEYSWKLVNDVAIIQFPQVSYSNTWPLVDSGAILNWRNDVGYWGDNASYNGADYPPQGGQSLYTLYWGPYISSLYSKYARRLTAEFILNNVDLQTFSFDDVIFVNGTYYRPEKIIDAQIGERMPTKVQLIKLLNYKVPRIPAKASLGLGLGYNTAQGACVETIVEQTVSYYPPLEVGNVLSNMDIVGDFQFFKIISSTQPGFDRIDDIIEIGSSRDVLDFYECAPVPTATAVPTSVPTATPVPPTPTPTSVPITYYAQFVECDDPAGAVIEVFDSSPISTGLVLKDNGVCYQYLNVGGTGVNGNINTFQQFDNCATCSAVAPTPTPTATPDPTPIPTPTPTALPAEGSISFVAAEPLVWDDITAGPSYAGTVTASGNWTLEPVPQPGGAPYPAVTITPLSGTATGGQPISAYYDGNGYGDDTYYTVNLRVNGVIVDSFQYYVGVE